MTQATAREALGVLAELRDLPPDVRLGQLLAHLGFLGEDQAGKPLWAIDDQLLDVLYHPGPSCSPAHKTPRRHRRASHTNRRTRPVLVPSPLAGEG